MLHVDSLFTFFHVLSLPGVCQPCIRGPWIWSLPRGWRGLQANGTVGGAPGGGALVAAGGQLPGPTVVAGLPPLAADEAFFVV